MSPAARGKGPRSVIVTGGAGFIGSHVADRYLADGWRVTVIDDLSTGRRERVPEGARFVELDVGDPTLADVFDEERPQVVNHHAAQMDVRVSVEDPREDARTNVSGLLHVLECARRYGAGRVVHASSGGVLYGEADRVPTGEDAPLQPLSPYGVSKLAGEHYLHCYAALHGLEYAALRYGNVYGPRQDSHGEAGVVAIFGRAILEGRPVTIYGDGRQERDFVYVGDVVEANLLATAAALPPLGGLTSRAWNIGTGRGTSVHELADRLMAAASRTVERRPAPPRPGELARSVLDPARAADGLGWRPRVSLDEGLRRTLAFLETEIAEVR